MKMRHRLLGPIAALAAAAAVCGLALPAAAADYKSEYRLSIVLAPPTPWGQAAKIWSDLVKERTQGRINIKLYPGVSLIQGDQTREFSALRQGVIDMAVGSTINWSPQVKELNLFSLPFLMPDYAAIDALTQGSVGKKIFQRLEQGGVVPLAWGENGYREVTNSKRAIKSPADLKGMKIRVVGSPIYSDIFSALGANPTQMSWADAQPALSSGAVDGQENPLFLFNVLKMQNVGQKFVTAWGHRAPGCTGCRQAGNRDCPQRPDRSRQARLQGHRGHGRERHLPDARRARRVCQGHPPGLREVEEHRGRRPGQGSRRRDRCAQEVT